MIEHRQVASMTVGENLRFARDRADMTQRAVSKITGINYKTISNWENDVSHPSPGDLIALADTYRISLDKLVGRRFIPKPSPKSATNFALNTTDVSLIKKYHALDERGQETVDIFIDIQYAMAKNLPISEIWAAYSSRKKIPHD